MDRKTKTGLKVVHRNARSRIQRARAGSAVRRCGPCWTCSKGEQKSNLWASISPASRVRIYEHLRSFTHKALNHRWRVVRTVSRHQSQRYLFGVVRDTNAVLQSDPQPRFMGRQGRPLINVPAGLPSVVL